MRTQRRRQLAAVAATVSIALGVGSATIALENHRHATAVRAAAVEQLASTTHEVEAALRARLVSAQALAAFHDAMPTPTQAEFDRYVNRLVGDVDGIRGVMVAPDLRITYVWPAETFEEALGFRLDALPVYQDTLAETLDRGELVLVGPIPAPLEGTVLVAAMPLADDGPGLTIVLLDHEELLGSTSLAGDGGSVIYAVTAYDTVDPNGRLITGPRWVRDSSPVTANLQLPGARWQILAAPTDGWPSRSPAAAWMMLATLALTVSAATLVSRRYTERDRLRRAVDEATVALRASNARYEAVSKSAPDSIITVDIDGEIASVNPAAEVLLGVRADALRGRSLNRFLSVDITAGVNTGDELPRPGRATGHATHADGYHVPVEVASAWWSTDGRPFATAIVRDTSEREESHRALQRYAARLEDVNEELQALDRIRADFVAVASHEIRTPLTAIGGFVDTLASRWDQIEDADRRRYLDIVRAQTIRLSTLVTNVLQVAKLESGGMETRLATIDLGELLHTAAAASPVGEDVPIEVSSPPDVLVSADPLQVTKILDALVSNAATYGASPIEIALSRQDRTAKVEVRDHGPGVPESFRESLFEKFAQASTGDRRTARGTGLGLAVARGLARIQGGDLTYDADDGPGAVFVLQLPLAGGEPPIEARDRATESEIGEVVPLQPDRIPAGEHADDLAPVAAGSG